jgi:hypothetical protein
MSEVLKEEMRPSSSGRLAQDEAFDGKSPEEPRHRRDRHALAARLGPGERVSEQRGQIFAHGARKGGLNEEADLALVVGQAGDAPAQKSTRIDPDVARLVEVPAEEAVLDATAEREDRACERGLLGSHHDAAVEEPMRGMSVAARADRGSG